MSANKFDNQVQQKMDELRLQPTAQVWEEVERRIREKKRRRVIIFWFLFAGLLISGGAWWMLNQQDKNEIAKVAENKEPARTENKDSIKSDQQNNISNSVIDNSEINSKTKERLTNGVSPEPAKPPTTKQRNKTKDERIAETHVFALRKRTKAIDTIPLKEKDPEQEIEKNNSAIVIPVPIKKEEEVKKQDDPDITPAIKASDSREPIINTDKQEIIKEADSSQISNSSPETDSKKNNRNKNKWETSLSVAFGTTRLTNGKIASFGEKSFDAYSSQNTNMGGSGPRISYADSIPLKGASLRVGASAKRNIGKKTAFSVGLNFSYYSMKQRIGSFKDSLLTVDNAIRSQTSNGFYRAGTSSTYRNKYYYIQTPILLHWQINKGNKLPPLIWDNGFAPSFLIGSDAVVYDRSARIFYKDKRVFNSFNLVYQTGLSARLFKDTKHPFDAGLYYNYHLSKLQKVDPPQYNYLSAYGIKLNWVIKK